MNEIQSKEQVDLRIFDKNVDPNDIIQSITSEKVLSELKLKKTYFFAFQFILFHFCRTTKMSLFTLSIWKISATSMLTGSRNCHVSSLITR